MNKFHNMCKAGLLLTGSSTSTHIDELHLETTSHYIRQLLSIAKATAEGLGILKWKETVITNKTEDEYTVTCKYA